MATIPLSGTNIRLLSGVPFSNDYKDTRWFDSQADQTSWFLSRNVVHSISQATYQRQEDETYIKVDNNIDTLWGTNYVMFQNDNYNSKWFYGFVTHLEYVNSHVTYVHFEIDVLQTWMFDMNFKPSYVIREHCPQYNSDGTPVISTIDEGLNYGTAYDNVQVTQYTPYDGYKWLVIVAKNEMHSGGTGAVAPTVVGTPTPLSVYLVPFKDNNTTPSVLDSDGKSANISKPTDVMFALYTDKNAVNNIVSLYITDYTGLPCDYSTNGTTDGFTFSDPSVYVKNVTVSDGTNNFNCLYVGGLNKFLALTNDMGNKYNGYRTVKESKLLMYPYTKLVLMDFKGNQAEYKNEYIRDTDLIIVAKGSLGVSNKNSYGVKDYNYQFSEGDLEYELGDESALINSDANDVPIITDMLSAYIQGHKNSMDNKIDSIVWNGAFNTIGGISNTMGAVQSGNVAGAINGAMGVAKGAGNTALQLQSINAKIKDIASVPPSISKMGSNSSYTIGNKYNGVYVIKKQIKPEYQAQLEDFFNMYGYKVHKVKTPNFHTRANWNYVQTAKCTITGNFNNDDLVELKSVFDNGITLWHTDDIGNYSLSNNVL